jgi:RNA polymerase sigma factor (sigma-70 family)
MVAVVLGTALSAFGANQLSAAAASSEAVQDLGRYCTTCWRNARLPVDSWSDCTQEVFCRMLQRVPTSQWDLALQADGEERREFLRAIDAVKKRVQRARRYSDAIDAADPRLADEDQLAEDRETVRRAAEELLSQRQQRILQLSFEGWSVQEISSELDMPVERVSDEKYKAVRKLRAHLADQDDSPGMSAA